MATMQNVKLQNLVFVKFYCYENKVCYCFSKPILNLLLYFPFAKKEVLQN